MNGSAIGSMGTDPRPPPSYFAMIRLFFETHDRLMRAFISTCPDEPTTM